ncbi:hypothetical protein PMAYCL1PPCAC_12307 [Pristionchus mayeri]|uniref:TRPM-like domain-containing protein n=1 Tax=Pristionchus mayeri TaxID=1317129 RepID=A0AAN4ZIT9_9BILA|nr:hypothetical protein PMAYCL1PPCAC_12307 [Pristionchus mayeri]
MGDSHIFADSISISTPNGIQLSPCLVLSSPVAIPQAVKYIYSQLAANANELDEGVAHLQLSLISHGNTLSQGYRDALTSSLLSIVIECSTWLLTSGEVTDPFSSIATSLIQKALPHMREGNEMLHLPIGSIPSEDEMRVDASFNTLFVLSRSQVESAECSARFRAHFSSRLSKPPPALLIGMPGEFSSSQAPAILLSPSANEKSPIALSIFAGSSSVSLEELVSLLEGGIPSLILEDSCELCSLLHSGWLLTRSSHFSPSSFSSWIESSLENLFSDSDSSLPTLISLVNRFFSAALSDLPLVEFLSKRDLFLLPSHLLHLCSLNGTSSQEQRIHITAAKLNCPSLLSSLSPDLGDSQLVESLLCECTSRDSRIDFLSSLLSHSIHLPITSNLLLRMLNSTDKHFFCTVVLPLLGYSSPPTVITEEFTLVVDQFIMDVTGHRGLFPSLSDSNSFSYSSLAIWSLLIHRPQLVSLFVSFSPDSLPLSLVISKLSRFLSRESEDWFFYSESLTSLSRSLSRFSLAVISSIHSESPTDSYRTLCASLPSFGGFTLPQLAYQTSSRLLLSHDSCQRWIHRLLYGRLQLRPLLQFTPKWFRILLSASFIFPIRHFISLRPPSLLYRQSPFKSPTVCLLHDIRQPRRSRALSTYSVISTRSDLLSAHLSAGIPQPVSLLPLTGQSTPQSAILPMSFDEMDSNLISGPLSPHKPHILPTSPPSLSTFYCTPIVKYWLSLLFKLIYLIVFGYSVLLPGCGYLALDTIVWLWTFIWWIESVWVAHSFSKVLSLSSMPWRLFDLIVVALFLLLLAITRIAGRDIMHLIGMYPSAYPYRTLEAFLLMYQCYATVLFYIPLSSQFGPLMIRVKIMVLRDFTSFLLLVGLIMFSSGISLFALSYPDRLFSFDSIRSLLSWTTLSLFTNDLSTLSWNDQCKKSALSRPVSYCAMLNSNREMMCPTQSWPVYITLIQYFIALKLILWPILFAFFAKTAKAVEEEADVIWKYQMYGLVHEFSLRPPLPPPLTPFFFLFVACCRKGLQTAHSLSSDHPDMAEKTWSRPERGGVYRNPSVPQRGGNETTWKEAAVKEWRKSRTKNEERSEEKEELAMIAEQLRAIALRSSMEKKSEKMARVPYSSSSSISRLVVPLPLSRWEVVLPSYSPPFYSRLHDEFPLPQQHLVDSTTQQVTLSSLSSSSILRIQCMDDLRSQWRSRQSSSLLSAWTSPSSSPSILLSSSGLPLNPSGRRGISGRGNHLKFGPNPLNIYVITMDNQILLTSPTVSLPSEYRFDQGSRDETLLSLLKLIGIPENEATVLCIRDETGKDESSPVKVLSRISPCEDDTDNAWREEEVWKVGLRTRIVTSEMIGYSWMSVDEASSVLSPREVELVSTSSTKQY